MKNIILIASLFLTLIIAGLSLPAHATDEVELIYDVVGLYQNEALQRFGKKITIEIEQTDKFDAYGLVNTKHIAITTGALDLFFDKEILPIVCHELGHIMSRAPFLEGEADYFAGPCMVRYLMEIEGLNESAAKAEAIAIVEHQVRHYVQNRKVYAERAYHLEISGVSANHSSWDCRLLTITNSIHGLNRPTCWYNP